MSRPTSPPSSTCSRTWATYQENMPADEFYGLVYSVKNYISPGSADYPYYLRKRNPLIIYDAISQDPPPRRAPPHANDAHDTTIDFVASFLDCWFLPLLTAPRVNDAEARYD
ncbi:hypothetical protein C8J57DRAFT_1493358 [Mycena rebaudengoi]|nr:hypothetical protein C8J57DRAFT_1493358 [Mycena rebaudengoi]